VKIEGVAHEFTSVPGVRRGRDRCHPQPQELICRLHGESGEVEVQVQKDGPGKVTAADIEAPSDLEILNPDSSSATWPRRPGSR
jgi:DNA-directed RNA polymerase subunit alpha